MDNMDFDEEAVKEYLPKDFEEVSKATFKKYDTNGDDRIDLNELYLLMKEVAKEFNYADTVTKEDAEKALQELDMNKNGVLEYDEFRKLFIGLCVVREVNKNK
jgi:Ca2+-binding EF-hand superfamily protein